MRTRLFRVAFPLLLASSVLSGCVTTSSTGDAVLNQGNWPLCSAIGGLAGGGLGAIESSAWAAGGAVAGAVIGGIICYARMVTKTATACLIAATVVRIRRPILRCATMAAHCRNMRARQK